MFELAPIGSRMDHFCGQSLPCGDRVRTARVKYENIEAACRLLGFKYVVTAALSVSSGCIFYVLSELAYMLRPAGRYTGYAIALRFSMGSGSTYVWLLISHK